MHDYDEHESDRQQVILDTMTLLVGRPVDEKPELPVNLEHGDEHRNHNAERGDAAQESDDQAEAAKELRGDGEVGEWRGDAEMIVKCADSDFQARTAEPTQKFLRAVGEESNSQDHSRDRQHPIAIGSQ